MQRPSGGINIRFSFHPIFYNMTVVLMLAIRSDNQLLRQGRKGEAAGLAEGECRP